ncbi:uncharacterized protein LOC105892744 [Clupea harengus]|uniref:Uncharacterized protein LOC105892744 n=1 Tax=Clupea harengus TaxID=7950 RepID=A0A8M1KB89_CLUHA|nr:uncharacterized protein LOC105892744 [Clupea harengus]
MPAADWPTESLRGGADSQVLEPSRTTSTEKNLPGNWTEQNQMTARAKMEDNLTTTCTYENQMTARAKMEENLTTTCTYENQTTARAKMEENLPTTCTYENQTTARAKMEENLTTTCTYENQTTARAKMEENTAGASTVTRANFSTPPHSPAHGPFQTVSTPPHSPSHGPFQTAFPLVDRAHHLTSTASPLVEWNEPCQSQEDTTSVLQHIDTLKGAVEGCVYDVCAVRSPSGGQCVCLWSWM